MDNPECETHRREMTVLEQIDTNVRTLMDTVSGINGRVRKTEEENAEQRVAIKGNIKSIDNIKKIIWGTVLAIIGTLSTFISKIWEGK